jgi:hypothetical protein
MTHSKADTVRLKAALEVLQLAGVSKETRLTLTKETHELDDSEVSSRLEALLNKAAETVIEAECIDITEADPSL